MTAKGRTKRPAFLIVKSPLFSVEISIFVPEQSLIQKEVLK